MKLVDDEGPRDDDVDKKKINKLTKIDLSIGLDGWWDGRGDWQKMKLMKIQ